MVITWPGHSGYQAELADLAGRTIRSAETATHEISLKLDDLSTGVYIVRLMQEGEMAFVKFVIPR